MDKNLLGIFLKPNEKLAENLNFLSQLGVKTAQLLCPQEHERTAETPSKLLSQFQQAGIDITVLFCGFPGESYETIPHVETTVGLAPKEAFEARFKECLKVADFGSAMNIPAMALHLGFIPQDTQCETHQRVVRATQDLCDYCAAKNMYLHLETGQEKAKTLLNFIQTVDRVNLAVNFDPANMVLYGSGEPVSALRLLGNYVKSVHIKDAVWSKKPGTDWGTEVLPGTGEARTDIIVRTLLELNYTGPLTVENEIGGNFSQDITKTIKYLDSLLAEYVIPE